MKYVYYLIASGTMLFLGCLIGGAWFIWQRYKGTTIQPITNGLNNPEVEGSDVIKPEDLSKLDKKEETPSTGVEKPKLPTASKPLSTDNEPESLQDDYQC